MKSVILASMFLLPQVHAACSYDVAPIRTLLQTLDAAPSYDGTRVEREALPEGGISVRNMTGGWSVQEISPDHWKFNGGFCSTTICEDSEVHYSIEEGCLKSGTTVLDVAVGTEHELDFSFLRDGIYFRRILKHTPSPNSLTIRERATQGKKWVYSSFFRGRSSK